MYILICFVTKKKERFKVTKQRRQKRLSTVSEKQGILLSELESEASPTFSSSLSLISSLYLSYIIFES